MKFNISEESDSRLYKSILTSEPGNYICLLCPLLRPLMLRQPDELEEAQIMKLPPQLL